ncbi:hypothetical protein I4U23_007649 [Adineta vaga]|nr:hypothetical protein I4U23_007649 [Adineta vaga]
MDTGIVNPNYQPQSVYYTSPGQFQHLQGQVNDVTEIMRNNIRLGLERGANLDDLEIKAEDLSNTSNEFAHSAHRVRQKFWWQNVQMWIIIGLIATVIIVLIIVLSVLAAQKKI